MADDSKQKFMVLYMIPAAVMDDWVNAMSFDTTKRVGGLRILYTADRCALSNMNSFKISPIHCIANMNGEAQLPAQEEHWNARKRSTGLPGRSNFLISVTEQERNEGS